MVKTLELVREGDGDDVYEYYPLGEYVVVAPGVCGGRPTFKYPFGSEHGSGATGSR